NQSPANRAIARDFGTSEAPVRRHRAIHVAGHMPQGQAPPVDRGGRPTKFSDDRVQRLLAAIRAGNTLRAAAMSAGITEDTVANWRRSSSAFSDAVTRAEAEALIE